jgi:membrane protein
MSLSPGAPTEPPRGGRWSSIWKLISDTIDGFTKDRGELAAAALAYNTLLSIAPLVIIAVAIAGAVLGEGSAHQEMMGILRNAMGSAAASTVQGWVDEAAAGGKLATAIGAVLALWAASRLATQLRNALNQVFNVDVRDTTGLRAAVSDFAKTRASAFLVVLASGPLLILVVASRTLLTGFHQLLFASSPWSGVAVQALQLLLSVVVVAIVCAVIFRYVPDAVVDNRSAWRGGLVTSLLFNLGNALVGLYLGQASIGAAYGAAGSAVVLLLWLQYSAYMFLLGAEFTQRLMALPPAARKSDRPPPRRLLHTLRGPA